MSLDDFIDTAIATSFEKSNKIREENKKFAEIQAKKMAIIEKKKQIEKRKETFRKKRLIKQFKKAKIKPLKKYNLNRGKNYSVMSGSELFRIIEKSNNKDIMTPAELEVYNRVKLGLQERSRSFDFSDNLTFALRAIVYNICWDVKV